MRACLLLLIGVLAMPALEFAQTVSIRSSPDAVWAALTEPDQVRRSYLCPLRDVEPEVGGAFVYGTENGVQIEGEVVAWEPGKRLVHSFAFPREEDLAPEDPPTEVEYVIEAVPDSPDLVAVHLTHRGFPDEGNQTYHNVAWGWPWILSNLKSMLETGRALGEDEAEAAE